MQTVCTACKRTLRVPVEKLPAHLPAVQGRCPFCLAVFAIRNPMFQERALAFAHTEVADTPIVLIQERPSLTLKKDLRRIPLDEGVHTLGRKASISFPDDPFMSRIHCVIEVKKNASGGYSLILSDDGSHSPSGKPSSNGTFLNEERLGPYDKVYLQPGDILRLGHTEFVVEG